MFVSAVVAFGFENLFAFVAIALDGAEAVPHGSDTHTHTHTHTHHHHHHRGSIQHS